MERHKACLAHSMKTFVMPSVHCNSQDAHLLKAWSKKNVYIVKVFNEIEKLHLGELIQVRAENSAIVSENMLF